MVGLSLDFRHESLIVPESSSAKLGGVCAKRPDLEGAATAVQRFV